MDRQTKRKIMLAIARLYLKVLELQVDCWRRKVQRLTLDDKRWDESKHPRKQNGQFGKGSGGTVINKETQDVTNEYFDRATPGQGKLYCSESYDLNLHKNEVDTASILHKSFGGDIWLLTESKQFGEKTPDCEWNGTLWEFKNLGTEKAADGAIRRGLKQIDKKPGGLVLNYGNHEINYDFLDKVISDRMRRGLSADTDIIIIQNGEVRQIKRYKK